MRANGSHKAPASSPCDRRTVPARAQERFWQASDNHAIRRIDWPAPKPAPKATPASPQPRGSILFLPGRGDNYEKYLETLEEWHQAGWQVSASDWRGQAGSGRLGKDETTGHIEDFALWVSDLEQLWREWHAQVPGPHILAGHSMGGHLALRAIIEGKVCPDAAVLSAPMLRMAGPPIPLPILHAIAGLMCKIGDPTRPAWKWSERPGVLPEHRQDLLTFDDARYADEVWWREKRPELAMGPASWRWVERSFASTRLIERKGAMESVSIPVLILSTKADRLVSHAAARIAAARLPQGELVEFGAEARHEIWREADAVRGAALRAVAAFLDRSAPARTAS